MCSDAVLHHHKFDWAPQVVILPNNGFERTFACLNNLITLCEVSKYRKKNPHHTNYD